MQVSLPPLSQFVNLGRLKICIGNICPHGEALVLLRLGVYNLPLFRPPSGQCDWHFPRAEGLILGSCPQAHLALP